jgi:hypothetical protein
MLDCDLLEDDFSRLARDGNVHRFLRAADAAIWRRELVTKARARGLRIRTSGRQLEQWQLEQRHALYGFDDLGVRTWLVTAALPDRLKERMADEAEPTI